MDSHGKVRLASVRATAAALHVLERKKLKSHLRGFFPALICLYFDEQYKETSDAAGQILSSLFPSKEKLVRQCLFSQLMVFTNPLTDRLELLFTALKVWFLI